MAALFTTPLGMRIDEGLGGTPAELSILVFGPDLAVLSNQGSRLAILRNNGAAFPPPPPPPPPIVLSVAGTNTKSRTVDLRWTGASGTNVHIYRNGIAIVSTPFHTVIRSASISIARPRPWPCREGCTAMFVRKSGSLQGVK